MKLNILPARTGYLWVKSGFALFFFKPTAFLGFFTSFMLLMILLSNIPYVGSYLTMLAFPAMSLGMMSIGNECVKLKKNMVLPMTPPPLFMAWLTIRRAIKPLFNMGIWFAFGFAAILLVGAIMDNGEFAKLYLQGGELSKELMEKDGFRSAVLVSAVLYLPLAAVFWFAPALTNWKQMPLTKSLFFSAYAVFRNWRAFGLYVLTWSAVFSTISALVLMLTSAIAGEDGMAFILLPLIVLLSTVFMASTFPTFVDCFQHTPQTADKNL